MFDFIVLILIFFAAVYLTSKLVAIQKDVRQLRIIEELRFARTLVGKGLTTEDVETYVAAGALSKPVADVLMKKAT